MFRLVFLTFHGDRIGAGGVHRRAACVGWGESDRAVPASGSFVVESAEGAEGAEARRGGGAEGHAADAAHAADGGEPVHGEPAHADEALELTLMGISSAIAILGSASRPSSS
jgi:hypothetical protein